MKTLKSLKEFQQEVHCLSKEQMKNLSGAYKQTWTQPTQRKNGCKDEDHMAQDYRWNGSEYVKHGAEWREWECDVDVSCGLAQL